MKLLKIILRVQDIKKYKLRDTYSYHKFIYNMFDNTRVSMQESSGFLWSLEDHGNFKEVIILTKKEPNITDDLSKFKLITVPEKLFDFENFNFKICINPVKRRENKAIPLTTPTEIISWFSAYMSKKGMTIDMNMLSLDKLWVDKFTKGNLGEHTVTINKCILSGILHVNDKDLFINAFSNGLGREKSFGCGLLRLSPIF